MCSEVFHVEEGVYAHIDEPGERLTMSSCPVGWRLLVERGQSEVNNPSRFAEIENVASGLIDRSGLMLKIWRQAIRCGCDLLRVER